MPQEREDTVFPLMVQGVGLLIPALAPASDWIGGMISGHNAMEKPDFNSLLDLAGGLAPVLLSEVAVPVGVALAYKAWSDERESRRPWGGAYSTGTGTSIARSSTRLPFLCFSSGRN